MFGIQSKITHPVKEKETEVKRAWILPWELQENLEKEVFMSWGEKDNPEEMKEALTEKGA